MPMWTFAVSLAAGLFLQVEELVINPVPRPVVVQQTQTIAFTRDTAGFRALSQCRLAVDEGILVITSEGIDPYMAADLQLPGPRCRVTVVHRTTKPGGLSVYWSTGQQPGFSEARARHVAIIPDGQWHEYTFDLPTPGGLRQLRIDPGSAPGRYEIKSVSVASFTFHPLEIDRVRKVENAVEFRLRNHGSRAVRCQWAEDWEEIPAGESRLVLRPVKRNRLLDEVTLEVRCEGLPSVSRRVFLYHDDFPASWVDCSAQKDASFTLEVCPQENVARLRRSGKTICALAPIVGEGNPEAPGVFGSVPPLELLRKANGECLLGWRSVRVCLRQTKEELVVDLWTEESHEATSSGKEPSSPPGWACLEGPVVRVFGPLEQGLFAGLEYLGKGEPSSSKADIETEEHIRFAPDRLKVTMPLMAFVTPAASVAMTWGDMNLQPIYATPNFFDGTAEHRMSLQGAAIKSTIRVASGRLEDCILWAVGKHGLPPVPPRPRSQEDQDQLCLWALTEGPLRDANGWGHCVELNWTRQFYVDMVSTIWHLSGKLPDVPQLVPNGAHLPNEVAWLLTGRADQWLAHLRARTEQLLRSQEPDGSFRYRGQFQRGHFEDTASGHCARPAALLLEAAYFLGDQQALEAGLKTLEYMKRFCVPRGAQTWELSLHTPDILASAELVRAYVRGYELTGREDFLKEARRWALSGIPFVYLWGEYPIMVYATIPVYGATHYRSPNWMGLPVQWCGIVYAYAVNMLAPYDNTIDWRRLAEGILVAAQQMQVPREQGSYAGLLPDALRIREQHRQGPFINPCAIVSLDRAIRGEIHRPVVATGDGHRVVAPFPVRVEAGTAVVRSTPGIRYQIVIDGRRIVDVVGTGRDTIPLGETKTPQPE
ncbi:MAG: hypothetical protein NZ899_02530 [Thermoguttaceae bacterium]|nr:hypothetical protein [Thermoguttaceae bacterium]MDW8079799.1 hypothetical protein [Thermoguttaceae bacterium]